MYAKIVNGVVTHYPYTYANACIDWPNTSLPTDLSVVNLTAFNIYRITLTERPTFNPITQLVIEINPSEVAGVWTQQWSVTELTSEEAAANLAEAKLARWEAIKAERDLRKEGGTLVSGKWFHSDRDSRIQQLGLVLMGASTPTVQWKTMDGTFITMSQTLAGGIFQSTATLDMALFANAEAHRAAMEASARPDQYDFSTGWPEHFAI